MKAASTSVKRNGILIVMLMGAFVTILNQTLMNVALPSIMKDFGITASQGQWLSTGFMLVNGVMIPMTAFLIERFTTRQLYLFAMITFAIGTAIGGFATDYATSYCCGLKLIPDGTKRASNGLNWSCYELCSSNWSDTFRVDCSTI